MGIVFQFIFRLVALLPLRVHYALGRSVSFVAEKVLRYRLSDVTVNFARSFPDIKYKELQKLVHRFYIHFGELFAEGVWFGGCRNPKRLRKQHIVEIENPEELYRLYDNSPSVMALMTHSGNWELIGGICNYDYSRDLLKIEQNKVVVVYLRQASESWNRFMKENRTAPLIDRKNYPGYQESAEIMRFVLQHKGEKFMYNFITDQYPYAASRGSLRVNFMHQECESMKGAAELARKLHMAVCYVSMPQVKRGLYKLKYVTICEDASSMSAEEIMKEYYRLLEADLQAQPWNYLWSHRRWK